MSNYNITILEEIAILSVSPRGEEKKLIKSRWNGGAPKCEIRKFSVDGTKSRREALTKSELLSLRDALNNIEL